MKSGPLTLGFTVYGGRHHFGPELQFGHVLGDYFDNQVLLIKTDFLVGDALGTAMKSLCAARK